MLRETPTISQSAYGVGAAINLGDANVGLADFKQSAPFPQRQMAQFVHEFRQPDNPLMENPMPTTRLVKVFIADPNESLPLENRLLYKGDEKITDLTDQELFYEIDIKNILEKHNAVRTATVDKATKSREKPEMLEPARVRDLRMQVIVLAQF